MNLYSSKDNLQLDVELMLVSSINKTRGSTGIGVYISVRKVTSTKANGRVQSARFWGDSEGDSVGDSWGQNRESP